MTAFAHKLVLSSAREARTRKKIWLIAPFHNRGAALSPESLPMLCDPFIAFIQGIAAVCLLKELAHRGQETPPPPHRAFCLASHTEFQALFNLPATMSALRTTISLKSRSLGQGRDGVAAAHARVAALRLRYANRFDLYKENTGKVHPRDLRHGRHHGQHSGGTTTGGGTAPSTGTAPSNGSGTGSTDQPATGSGTTNGGGQGTVPLTGINPLRSLQYHNTTSHFLT